MTSLPLLELWLTLLLIVLKTPLGGKHIYLYISGVSELKKSALNKA